MISGRVSEQGSLRTSGYSLAPPWSASDGKVPELTASAVHLVSLSLSERVVGVTSYNLGGGKPTEVVTSRLVVSPLLGSRRLKSPIVGSWVDVECARSGALQARMRTRKLAQPP